jgi:hypothetical protein
MSREERGAKRMHAQLADRPPLGRRLGMARGSFSVIGGLGVR